LYTYMALDHLRDQGAAGNGNNGVFSLKPISAAL